MLKCLFEFGGLGLGELVGKLLSMGCDGNNVFQGHQNKCDVAIQGKGCSNF